MDNDGERQRNRQLRLDTIKRHLYWNQQGATAIELAALCEVHRSRIYADIDMLCEMDEPISQVGSRFFLNREDYLSRISVNLREALALYLAARLLTKQSDKHNPHVISALDKLGESLNSMHPIIGQHIHRAAQSVRQRPVDAQYVRIFEIFAQAWGDQHRVEIDHWSTKRHTWETRTIAPYYLEVSGIGFATYVIGHDSKSDSIRTFKLERIGRARALTDDLFCIPETFDPQDRLGNAWGVIWPAEDEIPIEVRLRFSSAVAWRVKESVWHPSQVIEDLPDGGCRYTVRIGSTVEIRPWVRGWGQDVTVEAPADFRQFILNELRNAVKNYGEDA